MKLLELDTLDKLNKNAERQTFFKCQIVNLPTSMIKKRYAMNYLKL